jgi:IMP dehydrogenase/GMP reductase
MPKLHDAIKQSKSIHGNSLVIMSGNVSSVEAFDRLAKTGIDYIRVGIGGGNNCETTNNTGVGQECLLTLIEKCRASRFFSHNHSYIVADGISTYINQCNKKHSWNINGYAAINSLLYAGADYVMIGSLFAQCIESAGEKKMCGFSLEGKVPDAMWEKHKNKFYNEFHKVYVNTSGMSTHKEQSKYNSELKPSEGNTKTLPVLWSLSDWLYGSKNQDEDLFLSGWTNALKSAMSYVGADYLCKFKF